MSKRKEKWLPSGRSSGWYDDSGKYHAGPAPKSVLKKLYPNLYPNSRSPTETEKEGVGK